VSCALVLEDEVTAAVKPEKVVGAAVVLDKIVVE
jgi:hypothetical protein